MWLAAEVILFVTVGAAIDISYILNAGLAALWIVCIGLVLRSLGVVLSLLGTNLNFDERLFCVLSYLPKATVQAAIGSVPLAMGLPCGAFGAFRCSSWNFLYFLHWDYSNRWKLYQKAPSEELILIFLIFILMSKSECGCSIC